MTAPTRKVIARECKHVAYAEANDGSDNDMVLVKERLHFDDGTTEAHVLVRENYERPFYITKTGFRNHTDKKEYEEISRVDRFMSTQIKLGRNINRALGGNQGSLPIRRILRSPFVYGADVTPSVLIKHSYQKSFPDANTPNTVAGLDIETDVVNGNGDDILMLSLSMGEKKTVYAVRSFFGTRIGVEQTFAKLTQEYIPELLHTEQVDFRIFDTPLECVIETFKRLHEWKPDIVSIWNMNFDLPKILRCITMAGYDPASIISDPIVPDKYKKAKYTAGKAQKVTASGNTMSLHPADQWHIMDAMSSFYFVDSMCFFKRSRPTDGNEISYALDYILDLILGVHKLKFKMADHLTGLAWHQFLQKNYPIEYCIYGAVDTVRLVQLDAKTNDLAQTISLLCGISEYSRFPSTPRRLADDLEFFVQEQGRVFGTTSDDMVDELDQYVMSMNGWIITLASHLIAQTGLMFVEEFPNLVMRLWAHVADLDLTGAYPTGNDVLNQAKETTYRELSRMEGYDEETLRQTTINLTGGETNAVKFCSEIYKLPTMEEMATLYRNSKKGS